MRTMKVVLTAAVLGAAAVSFSPDTANAQSACEVYRVKAGDTLRKISRRAYGTDKFFASIYEANVTEIGRNPNIIDIGQVLQLPCEDGSLPDEATHVATDVGNSNARITLITANGYLPYTDESLPGRGLITRLVETSILRADQDQKADVVFVNDWAAHLEALLPSLAFDASFPWSKPDCSAGDKLTAMERYSCENYVYSQPLYEIVDGFFAIKGSGYDETGNMIELRGASICRPEGYPTSHLQSMDLMPPVTELVQLETAEKCFDALILGQVDIVSLDTRSGDASLAALGLEDEVVVNPHLMSIVPLQVAAHKSNPEGLHAIELLNRGLHEMLSSGEWNSIVADGLQHQMEIFMN